MKTFLHEPDKGDNATTGAADPPTAEEKAAAEKAAAEKAAAEKLEAEKKVKETHAEVKPTILQKAAAMISDKTTLLGAISTHEKTIGELKGTLAQRDATVVDLNKKLEGMTELEAVLKKAQAEKTDVATVVAAAGFDPNKLPVQQREGADKEAPTSLADFQKKHGELSTENKTAGASAFYKKYAHKFGLEPAPAAA